MPHAKFESSTAPSGGRSARSSMTNGPSRVRRSFGLDRAVDRNRCIVSPFPNRSRTPCALRRVTAEAMSAYCPLGKAHESARARTDSPLREALLAVAERAARDAEANCCPWEKVGDSSRTPGLCKPQPNETNALGARPARHDCVRFEWSWHPSSSTAASGGLPEVLAAAVHCGPLGRFSVFGSRYSKSSFFSIRLEVEVPDEPQHRRPAVTGL